jgi:hypothetical protein
VLGKHVIHKGLLTMDYSAKQRVLGKPVIHEGS